MKWQRVHILPDHAFFNHQIHVAGGVGCVSCHGRIDQMEKVAQQQPLNMFSLDPHVEAFDMVVNELAKHSGPC